MNIVALRNTIASHTPRPAKLLIKTAPNHLRGLVSQLIDPISGAKIRLPSQANGTSTVASTALMSNHQIIPLTIPVNFQTLTNSGPGILVDYSASNVPSRVPLWNLDNGFPIVQLWDPMFPVICPAFNPALSGIQYLSAQFLGAVGVSCNEFVIPYNENAGTPVYTAFKVDICPAAFGLVAGPDVAGLQRPVAVVPGNTSYFWADSGSTLEFRGSLVYPGTGSSFAARLDLFWRDETGMDMLIEDTSSTTLVASGGVVVITFADVRTSGWFRLQMRVDLVVSVAAPNTLASFQNVTLALTNSLAVQTRFIQNPTVRGLASQMTSVRLLGNTLLGHCTSPVMFKGGRIAATIGHNVSDSWTHLTADPISIDTTPKPSYYNGPFITNAEEDGGLYSVLLPKNYGRFPVCDYSTELARGSGTITNVNITPFPIGDRSYGFNFVHLRPDFASVDTNPNFQFQLILAQTIEFTTESQAFQLERTTARYTDWGELTDAMSRIYPFCANPEHGSKISQFLRGLGKAVEILSPVGMAVSMATGNPELAAIFGVTTVAGERLSHFDESRPNRQQRKAK